MKARFTKPDVIEKVIRKSEAARIESCIKKALNQLSEARISCMDQVCEQFPLATFSGDNIIIRDKVVGRIVLTSNDTEAWYEVKWRGARMKSIKEQLDEVESSRALMDTGYPELIYWAIRARNALIAEMWGQEKTNPRYELIKEIVEELPE